MAQQIDPMVCSSLCTKSVRKISLMSSTQNKQLSGIKFFNLCPHSGVAASTVAVAAANMQFLALLPPPPSLPTLPAQIAPPLILLTGEHPQALKRSSVYLHWITGPGLTVFLLLMGDPV